MMFALKIAELNSWLTTQPFADNVRLAAGFDIEEVNKVRNCTNTTLRNCKWRFDLEGYSSYAVTKAVVDGFNVFNTLFDWPYLSPSINDGSPIISPSCATDTDVWGRLTQGRLTPKIGQEEM